MYIYIYTYTFKSHGRKKTSEKTLIRYTIGSAPAESFQRGCGDQRAAPRCVVVIPPTSSKHGIS